MELKDKIKELRKEHGLSLEKFARMIDVSDVAVLKWEQGKTEPKASNLKAIAVVFNIDLMDFLEVYEAQNNRKSQNIQISNSFNGSGNNKITF